MPYYPPGGGSDATKLPLAGGTMTGTITSTMGTITANTPALTATQTWNAGAVTFRGMFLNVTNTASAAASRLFDFQLGGVSKVSFQPSTNQLHIAESGPGVGIFAPTSVLTINSINDAYGGFNFPTDQSGLQLPGVGGFVKFSSTASYAGSKDTAISRNAAGVLEINNGTAGTFRDLKLRDLIATAALNVQGVAASVGSGISIGGATRTTVGAAGGGSALPATPTGYLDWYVGSTAVGIPYYAQGA